MLIGEWMWMHEGIGETRVCAVKYIWPSFSIRAWGTHMGALDSPDEARMAEFTRFQLHACDPCTWLIKHDSTYGCPFPTNTYACMTAGPMRPCGPCTLTCKLQLVASLPQEEILEGSMSQRLASLRRRYHGDAVAVMKKHR